ncbi:MULTISPECIES: protein kinase [unclassified Acinetobacter]|uniref:protein kinase domain-containing protein n=1 Tax=unclassified Acinetobacter TaxID=196816 RepID=UPI00257789F4|nr:MULTISPECIES: protein kinase [unclassified Acinetobacter]MDM1765238.1 protein kinase [Acinetobacter sp. 226-1]MDM1768743.1 protein kinase [Acinetobacter sp. 226-4]
MNIKSLGTAINSARSQSFGRRVYCIESTTGKYWVKQQLAHVNAEYERGFLNELEMYSRLNALESSDHSFLSNFSILDIRNDDQTQSVYLGQQLCVEHTDALFVEHPQFMAFSQVICILKQSLDVLENLHELGFIHGDLKVEHFRQQSERLCLIDFEQTCHLDDVKHMPNTATPRYMAPELFHAQPKSVQTDLYALGIIWLEWLTQEKLQAKSYQDWAFLHCQDLKIELVPKFYALNEILNLLLMKKKQARCTNIYQIKQLLSKIG